MIRDHWAIGELSALGLGHHLPRDQRRIRTENAPSNFTTLNHMANNLFRKAPGKTLPAHETTHRRGDGDYLVSLIAA